MKEIRPGMFCMHLLTGKGVSTVEPVTPEQVRAEMGLKHDLACSKGQFWRLSSDVPWYDVNGRTIVNRYSAPFASERYLMPIDPDDFQRELEESGELIIRAYQ